MIRIILSFFIGSFATSGNAAEKVSIEIREGWYSVFANQKVGYHVEFNSPVPADGRLLWRVSANRATIQRGEYAIRNKTSETVPLALELPSVKSGIVMEATLQVEFLPSDGSKAESTIRRPLRIISKDQFGHHQVMLERLNIHLFDPEETTAHLFEKAGIPFTLLSNAQAVARVRSLAIIGGGVSFRDYRALPALMMAAAEDGAHVLCLAPSEGDLPIFDEARRQPVSMQFRGHDAVHELDKRLDYIAWPSDGVMIASSISVVGQGVGATGKVIAGKGGWPWVKLTYDSGGSVSILGYAMISKWDSGPSPRVLLARLFESFPSSKPQSDKSSYPHE